MSTAARRLATKRRLRRTARQRIPVDGWVVAGVAAATLVVYGWVGGATTRRPPVREERPPGGRSAVALLDLQASDWARARVDQLLQLPFDAARRSLLGLAEDPPEDSLPHLHGGLGDVTRALLERGRADLVALLDELLPATTGNRANRFAIHREIRARTDRGDAAVVPYAERLAGRHPTSVPLALHRSGGVEFLLAVVEDRRADFDERTIALLGLAQVSDPEVRRRLVRLADEPTPSPFQDNRGPGDAPQTFGSLVRDALGDRVHSTSP